MSPPAAVTDRSASLLETDPGLGRLLGPRDAAEFGHRRVLPVLAVPAGSWSPPPPAALGEATFGLVVLAGVLLREPPGGIARLLGPADALEPWSGPAVRWSACTPVQATVTGEAFLRAVARWPQAAPYMLQRARGGPAGLRIDRAGLGAAEDRLRELLWRLAARWGALAADGIGLPLPLGPAALAALAAVPEAETVRALRGLEQAGTATRRPDGTWLLRTGGRSESAGDELRERVATGLAQARATTSLTAELIGRRP